MEHLCTTAADWLVVGILSWAAGFLGIGAIVKRGLMQNRLQNEMLLAFGHYFIYSACQRQINKNCRTVMQTNDVTIIYEIYHKLGGNGTGKDLYEQFMQLPIKGEGECIK